jgi:hypothetical protein
VGHGPCRLCRPGMACWMSSGRGGVDENSTISMRELSGIGRSSDEKC